MILLAAVLALALAGCGAGASGLKPASLVLDFTPNAVHTGIYAALARHYDTRAGVRLQVIAPAASTDSVKLLASGKADFAILDIHDLAIARERGVPLVGLMAIVERPLAAVIAQPDVRDPRQLQRRLVGVSGLPSDTAVLDSIVSGAGGTPSRVRTITIGFNAVPDLLAGRVSAATAFWNDEGVAIRRARPGFHIFRVDSFGAPAYPELVLCAAQRTVRQRPGLARAVVRALVRGYGFTIGHPGEAASELESLVPGLDPALVRADLAVLEPAFRAPAGPGELQWPVLRSWRKWEARFGIVSRPPILHQMFDSSFFPQAGSIASG
jgi:NitT/TauT family transport system substrate-binding protein/putative hydroxymethylpyrimidine transport system substrate-binding protein